MHYQTQRSSYKMLFENPVSLNALTNYDAAYISHRLNNWRCSCKTHLATLLPILLQCSLKYYSPETQALNQGGRSRPRRIIIPHGKMCWT